MSRRQARDLAFKVLFQVDQVGADPNEAMAYLLKEKKISSSNTQYAKELVEGVLSHLDQIDEVIKEYSKSWKLDRMFSVDRVLLRLGIYEVMIEPGLHYAIAIDEAIELGKRYGESTSPAFINAVLDQVRVANEKKD